MSKGKKNGYICQECGGRIVTIDIDEGVTPFMLACRAKEGCKGMMFSCFYSIPQMLPAQYEWFMPESYEGYDEAMIAHFEQGGLDIRTAAEQHMHKTGLAPDGNGGENPEKVTGKEGSD